MNTPEQPEDKYPSLEESRRILRECSPSDFDGHTSFQEMTVEERIQWASRSAMAVWAMKQRSNETQST